MGGFRGDEIIGDGMGGFQGNDFPPKNGLHADEWADVNSPYNYLEGLITQFKEENPKDWTAVQLLEWLKLNKFKIIK